MKTDIKIFKFAVKAANVITIPTVLVWMLYSLFKLGYYLFIGDSYGLTLLDVAIHLLIKASLMCYAVSVFYLVHLFYDHIKNSEGDTGFKGENDE